MVENSDYLEQRKKRPIVICFLLIKHHLRRWFLFGHAVCLCLMDNGNKPFGFCLLPLLILLYFIGKLILRPDLPRQKTNDCFEVYGSV